MKKLILDHLWWVTFVVAAALLVVHSLNVVSLNVDSTSILLLLIILISPFVSSITKIKYGDFEAEIDSKEVERIKANLENVEEAQKSEGEHHPEVLDATDSIYELAESDPVVALAKIRIELEKSLKRLARTTSVEVRRPILGFIVKSLSSHEIISRQMGKSLSEVISICNRAIHGETIADDDARTIIELGVALIEEIYWITKFQTSSGSIISEDVITTTESEQYYYHEKYRLTSITPLAENPKRIVRELTQEQLSDLLENYKLYAEFIVELKEIPKVE